MDYSSFFLREMEYLERQASFENVENKCKFTRCIRQGSVEAPTLWLTLAKHVAWNLERGWKNRRNGDTY